MKRGSPRLLAIESPNRAANVMFRLLEPPGSCRKTLLEQLYSGSYGKPFVVDDGLRRFLHFDFDAVQSAMELSNPQGLALAYTRKMMSFLLFNPAPKRILLLGLGGGSLAKFCYGNLPAVLLTAVEINRDVIALREAFGIPANNRRFRVINADGARYVPSLAQNQDVILADACDGSGVAEALDSIKFYRAARQRLSAGGVFVTNLCGDGSSVTAHLSKLRDAFDDQLLTMRVGRGVQVIAFGFQERRPDGDWKRIRARAPDLKRRFGLDFPRYARRIAVDSKLPA